MNKKHLAIITLLAVFVVAVFALCGCDWLSDTDEGSEGLEILDHETFCTVKGIGTCTDTDVKIPDKYNGKPVTSIENEAFKNGNVKSVTLGANIGYIGRYAFFNNPIEKVTFAKNSKLTNIGKSAFENCANLKEITLPSDVKEIDEYAFAGCAALTDVNLNEGLEDIDRTAFQFCYRLLNLTIPSTVTSGAIGFYECVRLRELCYKSQSADINDYGTANLHVYRYNEGASYLFKQGDFVFYDNGRGTPELVRYDGNASDVMLPNNYNGQKYALGAYAFYLDKNVGNVIIPETMEVIGEYAFSNCTNLQEVTIPSNVKTIGTNAFEFCEGLATVNWNAKNCPNTPFGEHCASLTTINFGDSVETIGEYAFFELPNLTTVTIGKNVTKVEHTVFGECPNLSTITVSEENTAYYSSGNCLIDTATKTLTVGCKEVTIPNDGSVTRLGLACFYGRNIESVIVPSCVTEIDKYAFAYCRNLNEMSIQGHITSLGYGVFSAVYNLPNIDYAGTVSEFSALLNNDSFQDRTGVKTVTCSNGVLTLKPSQF